MEKLSFKSCFIFNPKLKSLLKKPSDDDKQDAKLLIYYPSCEDIIIKRSNMGIIEGTIQFNHSFNAMKDKEKEKKDEFLLAELNSIYYFSQKFEDEYYVAVSIEKKNKVLSINENVNYRITLFKSILNNFYSYFYLFHGTFKDIFFPNGEDLRADEAQFNNINTIFSDFITCYFDFIGNYSTTEAFQTPITDGILYSTCNIYPSLLFSILRVNEKFRDIKAISLAYKGFLIHNEIDIETMSLLYNMLYNNINGESYQDKFRYPIFKVEDEKEKEKDKINDIKDDINSIDLVDISPLASSPFLKGFIENRNNKKNMIVNNNYFIGCDLNNKKVFIPTLYLTDTQKMKLMIYNIKDLCIFLFFGEDYQINEGDIFDQMAVFLDVCFTENLNELKNLNFEEKLKEVKKEYDFVYYNKQNKSLRLSSSFYAKNYDIDKSKIPILEKIKELMMSNRIKKSVTKIEGQYLYYFEQFQKNVAILLKENKGIEEVKVKYFNKIIKAIEFY